MMATLVPNELITALSTEFWSESHRQYGNNIMVLSPAEQPDAISTI